MRRRWTQVSLRSLLLVMTCCAVAFGLASAYLRTYWQEQRLLAELHEGEGFSATTGAVGPAWFKRLVGGNKYAQRVVGVEIGNDFADDNLAKLRQFRYLRTVVITKGEVPNDMRRVSGGFFREWEWFRTLPDGTDVLMFPRVNDEGLAHLANIRSLEDLTLVHSEISDDGLAVLQRLPNLRALDIRSNQITNDGLNSLRGFPKLRELKVRSKLIDDGGLAHLGKLTQLQSLTIEGKVSDAGMGHLSQLTNLETLHCLHPYEVSRRMTSKLSEPTQVDFIDVPLQDALAYLESFHHILFEFETAELSAKDVDMSKTCVTLSRQGVPLRECLKDVLAPHGLDFGLPILPIVITTQEAAAEYRKGITELRKKLPNLTNVEVTWSCHCFEDAGDDPGQ